MSRFIILPGQPVGPPAEDDFEDQYIVRFKEDVDVDPVLTDLEDKHGFKRNFKYDKAFRGFSAKLKGRNVKDLFRNEAVVAIERDLPVEAMIHSKTDGGPNRIKASDKITATAVQWNQTITNTTLSLTDDFSTVHCFVLDTGIAQNHAEFAPGQVVLSYNAITPSASAADDNGHGTAAAGAIGGLTVGTAAKTKLYAVKVLDKNGSGYSSYTINGLNWVLNNKPSSGPVVVNMSLGGPKNSSLNSAVQACIDNGITVVVAAGNSGADACNSSPSSAPNAITVAAYDSSKTRPSWSNYGVCVDTFGPGVSITVPWLTGYAVVSGTSFSSPIVAGIIARYLKAKPAATPKQVLDYLNRADRENDVVNPGTGTPNRRAYWNAAEVEEPACPVNII